MEIYQADLEDLSTLTNLLERLYQTGDYSSLEKENKELLNNPNHLFYLAKINELPIAAAHFSIRYEYINGKKGEGAVAFLEGIFVEEAYRRQGIGLQLVNQILPRLKSKGITELLSDSLQENQAAHQFHLASGFKETQRVTFFHRDVDKELSCDEEGSK